MFVENKALRQSEDNVLWSYCREGIRTPKLDEAFGNYFSASKYFEPIHGGHSILIDQ